MSPSQPAAAPVRDRPPFAVVGSQMSHEEELFGRVFDKWVVRRFLSFLRPYRRKLYVTLGAVLLCTVTQLSIPLIIRGRSTTPWCPTRPAAPSSI